MKDVVSQVKPPQQPCVLAQSAPKVLGPSQPPSEVGIDVSAVVIAVELALKDETNTSLVQLEV